MFVPEKMRLNSFRVVSIPRNKDLFMRVGARPIAEMADGQVASYTNGEMDSLDSLEAQLLKDSQMPLAD